MALQAPGYAPEARVLNGRVVGVAPSPAAGGLQARDPRVCKYWRQGHCRNGDACRFTHAHAPASAGMPTTVGVRAREPLGWGRDRLTFSVCSLRMPPRKIQEHEGVTYFAIEVQLEEGRPAHYVLRRYNDFVGLSNALGREIPGAPFPGKHWFGCSGPQLEARRAGLEAWLINAVSVGHRGWGDHLRSFLTAGQRAHVASFHGASPDSPPPGADYGCYVIGSGSAPEKAQMAAPPVTEEEAPPASPATPPVVDASLYDVVVPAGSELLAISVPGTDGTDQVINFPVPPGTAPGTTLRLRFDPARKCLEQV